MSTSPAVTVKRLSSANEDEFYRVHSEATGNGWCHCVAWWVPTWDGFGERRREDNAALRAHLFSSGIHDGYLIYADGALAGWCQAWQREAFVKLSLAFQAPPEDDAWMIGCLLILPDFRARGVAKSALAEIVDDLKLRGARSVDAFPKRNAMDAGELWNGAESTYLRLGFTVVRDDPKRPLLRLAF